MSWNLSEQELTSVLSLPGAKRYSYFIKKVADWEEVWSLRNQDGWVLAAGPSGSEIVPVWPHKRFAEACMIGEWKDCKPAVIELSTWMERWIPGMAKDNRQVAVFATPEDKSVVVQPVQLYAEISEECEQYE
ncbi:MAG: DUF2750 domain-containing protein [Candidatus Electrothrix sp. ATG1]|nr:DUF2750 domain-containing protein [Candidatus Electrothrix sp. ATG1]